MRELELPEIEMVSGGQAEDETRTLETVTTTGRRITARYTGPIMIGGNSFDTYAGPNGSTYYVASGGGSSSSGDSEDDESLSPPETILLDGMTSSAVGSGLIVSDVINDFTGNTGDNNVHVLCHIVNNPGCDVIDP